MHNSIQIVHLDTHYFQYKLIKEMTPFSLMALFNMSKKRWNQYSFANNQVNHIQNDTILPIGSLCTHTFEKMDYMPTSFEEVDIIYEDMICLAVNKPAFLLVHDDGNEQDTLQERVNHYLYNQDWPFSSQAIHRIDYETSGIILFSKFPFFQGLLDQQFERHDLIKEYYALVEGTIPWNKKRIDLPISKNRHQANAMIVHPKGKKSISHVEIIKRYPKNTLVKVKIDSGRKHQIRVHLSYNHYPIVNDSIYGKRKDHRGLLLQNFHLKFYQPILNDWIDLQLGVDPRFQIK